MTFTPENIFFLGAVLIFASIVISKWGYRFGVPTLLLFADMHFSQGTLVIYPAADCQGYSVAAPDRVEERWTDTRHYRRAKGEILHRCGWLGVRKAVGARLTVRIKIVLQSDSHNRI